jgi:hypothetical protein
VNPTLLVLIPLLPLIASIIAGLFGKQIGRAGAHTITIAGVAVSCALSLYVLKQVYWDNVPTYEGTVYNWLVTDGIRLQVGFLVDRLTALMMCVVTAKSLDIDMAKGMAPMPENYSNTTELGSVLYTKYAYPFELAAMLLLVAIIAAIALTMRKRPGHKVQDISAQTAVRAKDRIRIVKMAAERPQAPAAAAESEKGA